MSKTLSFSVGAFLSLMLGACASVPAFAPSARIDEAGSYYEAMLLCHEYRLPTGNARVVALKPMLQCVEQAVERPAVPVSGPCVVFLIELKDQYEGLSDSRFTLGLARELDLAIHAVLRPLWRGTTRLSQEEYTEQEARAIREHLPITAEALRIQTARISPRIVLDPELERLRARFAALQSPQGATVGVDPWVVKRGNEGDLGGLAALCGRVKNLEIEVAHLIALWDDRKDLAEMDQKGVIAQGLKARYQRLLSEVSKKMSEVQEDVLKARKATGFQPISCGREDRA